MTWHDISIPCMRPNCNRLCNCVKSRKVTDIHKRSSKLRYHYSRKGHTNNTVIPVMWTLALSARLIRNSDWFVHRIEKHLWFMNVMCFADSWMKKLQDFIWTTLALSWLNWRKNRPITSVWPFPVRTSQIITDTDSQLTLFWQKYAMLLDGWQYIKSPECQFVNRTKRLAPK